MTSPDEATTRVLAPVAALASAILLTAASSGACQGW